MLYLKMISNLYERVTGTVAHTVTDTNESVASSEEENFMAELSVCATVELIEVENNTWGLM